MISLTNTPESVPGSAPIAASLSESLAVVAHQEACPKPCVRPPAAPAIDRADWNKLLEIWQGIGPTARRVLLMIGERLLMGRRQYNDDFDKPRDWDAEATFEDLDSVIYRTVKIVKRQG